MKKIIIFILLLSSFGISAQTIEELERQIRELQSELKDIEDCIEEQKSAQQSNAAKASKAEKDARVKAVINKFRAHQTPKYQTTNKKGASTQVSEAEKRRLAEWEQTRQRWQQFIASEEKKEVFTVNLTHFLNTVKNTISQTGKVVNSKVSEQVAKDIKEVFPNMGDWVNLKKHGETLKNAVVGINATKAVLLNDKSALVNDLKAAGEKVVKSLFEKGSAASNTISSAIALPKIGNELKELYRRTVNRVKDLANNTVEDIFSNKSSFYNRQNKNKKTERDMYQDANNTTNRSMKLYNNK
ncbi:MAG: hypothetical protein LBJ63_10275 [Prevotellaceae bacterium]|jgi:small-conductance mechanosensitive channel|nr:hypothetical protein [Prevotellaceae bacterium]